MFDTIPIKIGPVVNSVDQEEVSRDICWHVTLWLVTKNHMIASLAVGTCACDVGTLIG